MKLLIRKVTLLDTPFYFATELEKQKQKQQKCVGLQKPILLVCFLFGVCSVFRPFHFSFVRKEPENPEQSRMRLRAVNFDIEYHRTIIYEYE
jgi:hypothetical protein